MPRLVTAVALGTLVLAGTIAWAGRGSAILLDLSAGAARVLCL